MVAVGGIVIKENQVLTVRIGKKKGDGLLRIPGGIAKTSENLEEAVTRHVLDETGIECEPERIVGIRYAVRECRCAEKDEMYIVFGARYLAGTLKPGDNGVREAVFMPIPELLSRDDVVKISAEMVRSWRESRGLVLSRNNTSTSRRWNIYECYTLDGSRLSQDDEVHDLKIRTQEELQEPQSVREAHHSRL